MTMTTTTRSTCMPRAPTLVGATIAIVMLLAGETSAASFRGVRQATSAPTPMAPMQWEMAALPYEVYDLKTTVWGLNGWTEAGVDAYYNGYYNDTILAVNEVQTSLAEAHANNADPGEIAALQANLSALFNQVQTAEHFLNSFSKPLQDCAGCSPLGYEQCEACDNAGCPDTNTDVLKTAIDHYFGGWTEFVDAFVTAMDFPDQPGDDVTHLVANFSCLEVAPNETGLSIVTRKHTESVEDRHGSVRSLVVVHHSDDVVGFEAHNALSGLLYSNRTLHRFEAVTMPSCNGVPDNFACQASNMCDSLLAFNCPGTCPEFCTSSPTAVPTSPTMGPTITYPPGVPTPAPTSAPTYGCNGLADLDETCAITDVCSYPEYAHICPGHCPEFCTRSPTSMPTAPTPSPTYAAGTPTPAPTPGPTFAPTAPTAPTNAPTKAPTLPTCNGVPDANLDCNLISDPCALESGLQGECPARCPQYCTPAPTNVPTYAAGVPTPAPTQSPTASTAAPTTAKPTTAEPTMEPSSASPTYAAGVPTPAPTSAPTPACNGVIDVETVLCTTPGVCTTPWAKDCPAHCPEWCTTSPTSAPSKSTAAPVAR
eukprot:m.325082 g.325082  ORF g.325082 m.325082 type:complete len:595 (-) comp27644_c0_seq1:132-1916(-)